MRTIKFESYVILDTTKRVDKVFDEMLMLVCWVVDDAKENFKVVIDC